MPRWRRLLAGLVLCSLCVSPAFGQDVSLPGGGTSLRETHGDWVVSCSIVKQADGKKARLCSLSQQQVSRKTHQRALAIELRPKNGGAKGRLVLPFGLALAKGVIYRIDQSQPGARLLFRTCLTFGCVAEIDFDMPTVAALEKGKVLKLTVTADGGHAMSFSVPLTGFASAYQRVTGLMK